MANTVYITAGLPVAKDSGQSPSSGVNTVYVSAGLPPEPSAAEEETSIPVFMHHYRSQGIA